MKVGVHMNSSSRQQLLVHRPTGSAWYDVAEAETGWNGYPVFTVEAGAWLDAGTYRVVLVESDRRTAGTYSVHTCRSEGSRIRFVGSFTPETQPGSIAM